MRILYSFRSEDYKLPKKEILFNTVWNIHEKFTANPTGVYEEIRKWARPMNQLKNGLFFSINEETGPYPYVETQENNMIIPDMEISYITEYFVRIVFEHEGNFPYRVSSQNVRIKFYNNESIMS